MPTKRIVHDDVLTPMMILEALIEFTTSVADGDIADNRAQFDSILCRHHNKVAPKEQEKTPKYFAESTHSLRISQKFSNIKGKLKEAGTEIHLTLPRRSRSFGEKQLKQLQDNDSWAKFLKLNKAAGNKSNK
mgnify:FL=1|tara:strand:+ start:659 stop:1054 length:396 start_codon:yes stop_codon:yes gene_type:complete